VFAGAQEMKKFLRTAIPIIICILIFVYIFNKISPKQALDALTLSNIPLFILFALIYFFWIHAFDCYTIKHFISRFSVPITHKESWLVRGVSYLIMVINYHAAQGAFAIYFKKTHKAPLSKTLGTMAFISFADLILIFTSALIALSFTNIVYAGFDLRLFVLRLAPLIYIFYGLFILLWKNVDKPFVQKLTRYRFLNWIIKHDLFLIFREAKFKDYLILYLLRIPIVFAVIGAYNLALYTFTAHIDWITLYLYNPIIMFVSTLPITPAGLGTTQFLTIEFFETSISSPLFATAIVAPASLLLASNLLWVLANQVTKTLFGAICLFWTRTDLFKK